MTRLAYALLMLGCLVQAQDRPTPPSGQARPVPPIFRVLDANQDGVIDADEIANASAALRKLDTNGDGRLTPDEYRPKRPDGAAPKGGGQAPEARQNRQGAKGGLPPAEIRNEAQSRPAPGADGDNPEDRPTPMDQGQKPPRPKIDLALDQNGDEIIDADEIGNAPALLRKLDTNGDGKLSMDECFGKPGGSRPVKGGSK